MFHSRDIDYSDHIGSDSTSTASTDAGKSNNVTPIIIGVVAGGVAVIAITAGLLFFFHKKRRWDRIHRREEQLLAHHTQAGLKETDAELAVMAGRPSSSLSISRDPTVDIDDQPPTYQSLSLPVYDPSRYRDIDIPPAVKFAAMRQPSIQPVNGFSGEGPSQPSGGLNRPMCATDVSSLAQPSQSSGPLFRGPSPDWPRDSIQSDSLFHVSEVPVGSPTMSPEQEPGLPRRPKPVLSRLITNLD